MNKFTIELKNPISHPFFFWTETLLSYPCDEEIPALCDNNGKVYRCQTHDGYLYFICSIACGEHKILMPALAAADGLVMYYEETETSHIINNGKFIVYIPKTGQLTENIPAPVYRTEGAANTSSYLRGTDFTGIHTQVLTKGDVFCKLKVTYTGGSGQYKATVTVVYGYDFVSIDEEMDSLGSDCFIEITSHSLKPEHWYASTWPDDHWEPLSQAYGDYDWRRTDRRFPIPYNGEDPAFSNIPDDDKALQIRLGAYVPFFAYSVRPTVAFWNSVGDSLGFFVSDHETWDEGEYTIWGSSEKIDGKFYYENGIFKAKLALGGKSRSFAMCLYNRECDRWWFATLERLCCEAVAFGVSREEAKKLTMFPTTYTAFLHNRYAVLNLNTIKDWQLEYNGRLADIPYNPEKAAIQSAEGLKALIYSRGRAALATKGVEEFHDRPYTFEAVEMRMFYEKLVDAYVNFKEALSYDDEKTVTAMLLLTIYVCAGECCMPMKKLLGGHPNFLADVKSVVGMGAGIFPQHKHAGYFADVFEGYIKRNTKAHVRPAVGKWHSRGGRWTESPGIYTWAFLTPSIIANHLMKKFYDGKDRMSNPYLAQLACWLINYTTPPVDGRRRCLPIGAHSTLRTPFTVLELLGDSLNDGYPDIAANIEYLTDREDRHMESLSNDKDVWDFLYKPQKGAAHMPHLESAKYTGCGLVLRNRVGEPKESAVFLQQVDDGPNYRWGLTAQGSCGAIYYYADGKAYTHCGKEDTGDRKSEDTVYHSNFGVWKDGMYKSVGRNELTHPLYNLGSIQYARINASPSYSSPEYLFRSVLLGGDYLVIYDSVFSDWVHTRFSWFCEKEADFPYFYFVKGYTSDRFAVENYSYSEHITAQTKGRWYEGKGTSMCVVSPEKLFVEKKSWGCIINNMDYIFMNDKPVHAEADGISFSGSVGYARLAEKTTLALVDDGEVCYKEISIKCCSCGVLANISEKGKITGTAYSQGTGEVEITVDNKIYRLNPSDGTLHFTLIDGNMSLEYAAKEDYSFPPAEEFNRNTIYTKGILKY